MCWTRRFRRKNRGRLQDSACRLIRGRSSSKFDSPLFSCIPTVPSLTVFDLGYPLRLGVELIDDIGVGGGHHSDDVQMRPRHLQLTNSGKGVSGVSVRTLRKGGRTPNENLNEALRSRGLNPKDQGRGFASTRLGAAKHYALRCPLSQWLRSNLSFNRLKVVCS